MKITLESTTKIVEVDGVPSRIWEGETASGVRVHAYVTRIAVAIQDYTVEFDDELQACRTPSPEVAAIPLRLML